MCSRWTLTLERPVKTFIMYNMSFSIHGNFICCFALNIIPTFYISKRFLLQQHIVCLVHVPCLLNIFTFMNYFRYIAIYQKLGCYINSISHLKLHIFVVACWEVQVERSFTNNKLCVQCDVSVDVLRSI